MTRTTLTLALALAFTFTAGVPAAAAQGSTASLSGVVVDETGAAISRVVVTAVHLGTGRQREATTNESGSFTLALLPPGTYGVSARRDGFAPAEIKELVLNVNDEVAIRLQLRIAAVDETVTVIAEPTRVRTSPAVGTVVDRHFVENLPLNGRSFQSLIALTPGLVTVRGSSLEPGQFSVNGQRTNTNYFTVDGVSANIGVAMDIARGQVDGSVPGWNATGGTSSLVSIDAMQEFQIQTSTFAPEFGRTPGAQVSIVTRAGTNRLHGTAFEYLRNDAFDANDWFVKANGLAKPALRHNDFGGVLGGPIRTNRLFFFASYEGLRLRLPQVGITEVPSLESRQAAPAWLRPLLEAYPRPTGPALPSGFAPMVASYSDPSTSDATSVRLDYTMTPAVSLLGRYNHAPSSTRQRSVGAFALNNFFSTALDIDTVTTGATWVVSPRIVNESRVNYSRSPMESRPGMDDFGGAIPLRLADVVPPGIAPEDTAYGFGILGTQRGSYLTGKNVDNLQRQFNVVNTTTLNRGRHQLKFGADYREIRPASAPRGYEQIVRFATMAQAVNGLASSVSIIGYPHVELRFRNASWFAQDTWQASPRLTLTYGVRWDFNAAPTSPDGAWQTSLQSADNPATFAPAPPGTPAYRASYTNFAPRVGAAYALDEGARLEVRGGFGVFYDLGSGSTAGSAVTSFSRRRNLSNTAYPLTGALALPPDAVTLPYSTYYAYDPELKLPFTLQWNVAVERVFGARQTLTVTYVGAAGHRLLRRETYRNPTPLFQSVWLTRSDGRSNYGALQVQYQRRLSRGLQVLAAYTLGKSEDTASTDSASLPSDVRLSVDNEYGPSDFDVRHAFSVATSYRVPAPRRPAVRAVAGGWSVDLVMRAQSAPPVPITVVRDFGLGSFLARPDRVEGVPLYIDDPVAPGGRRFNRAAFVVPAELRQGNLPRNEMRGFNILQGDVALHRDIPLAGSARAQIRIEVFNVTNRPNFGPPNGLLTSSTFGMSTAMLNRSLGAGGVSGGFNPLYQIGGPRSIQLALKLLF